MKILLLNDNPVVAKLVTLSAQKTSDTLEVVNSLDAIEESSYDLLVVDDGLYNDAVFEQLQEKIIFLQSLYICSRDANEALGFTKTLKKPFLPTDLVELFVKFDDSTKEVKIDEKPKESFSASNEILGLESLEEFSLDDELSLDNEFSLDEELSLDNEFSLDDELSLDNEFSLDEELSLDNEFSLDDTSLDEDDEILGESILDNEEAQKVKDLLVETSFDELMLDDEADTEDILGDDELLGEDLSFEDEIQEEEGENKTLDDDLENILGLEEESYKEEVATLDETQEEELSEPDLESEIQNAMNELTENELESELDYRLLDEGLLDDSFDGLTTRELKLAIGEEVEEESVEDFDDSTSEVAFDEELEERVLEKKGEVLQEESNGIEALKNLLEALSDKKVAASMKGMQISINISLGVK